MLGRDEIFAILDAEVKDPEVPVLSVVELGIVRDVSLGTAGASDAGATVTVTPTYSGCPAMHEITSEIVRVLEGHGVAPVDVKTVYAPAWTTEWIPESAREKLRAYGIAPPGRAESDALVQIVGRGGVGARESVRCPYCDSADTVVRSEFGTTACKSILYCNHCRQPFEQFKGL